MTTKKKKKCLNDHGPKLIIQWGGGGGESLTIMDQNYFMENYTVEPTLCNKYNLHILLCLVLILYL